MINWMVFVSRKAALTPTSISVNAESFWKNWNCELIRPLRKNAHNPNDTAEIAWPNPQVAPNFSPYQPGFPTLGGSNAAKWSGPEMACNPPDNSPPAIVGLKKLTMTEVEAKKCLVKGTWTKSWDGLVTYARRWLCAANNRTNAVVELLLVLPIRGGCFICDCKCIRFAAIWFVNNERCNVFAEGRAR